jgi:lysozyme family protein
MVTREQMLETLKGLKRELSRRLFDTVDPDEITRIERALADLEDKIDAVVLAGLNEAAALAAGTADDLLEVVHAATTGPLDGYIRRLGVRIGRLRVQIEEAVNALAGEMREEPKTEDPEQDPALPPPQPAAPLPPDPVPLPSTVPAVVRSKAFDQLAAEYEAEWASCRVRPDKQGEIDAAVDKLRALRAEYEHAAADFAGMPWHFIGIIHGLEAGFRLDRHFHNGDPLAARTVRVPRGRPEGAPPFTWRQSARDAMVHMGFDQVTDWSIPHMLYLWERYNGFGYRFKGLRSPYLWSFSNLYSRGRYVADGVFDANAVSRQCGAAVMLKALLG